MAVIAGQRSPPKNAKYQNKDKKIKTASRQNDKQTRLEK